MGTRRSYKTDVSFLRAISIGVAGTRRVFEDLEQQDQQPIELERGSRSFKIWKKIKIKRIRVPDILCLRTGRRVESRGKTKLEITMSHSLSNPDRGWDHGLENGDYVALVACHQASEEPTDWQADNLVQYVSVADLREAYRSNLAISAKPKGVEQGFEVRLVWPALVANSGGIVSTVATERLQYKRRSDHRTISLSLSKNGRRLTPLVKQGEYVTANQILASVVPIVHTLPARPLVDVSDYMRQLNSSSLSDRYTAVKALSHLPTALKDDDLAGIVTDGKEHIYVRLEAASSLARRGDQRGVGLIQQCLTGEYLENRLEAVIVLGEVGTPEARELLMEVLPDTEQHPEIRAAAAWALGELHDRDAVEVLIASFGEVEEEIRIEAARALAKLASAYSPEIIAAFPGSDVEKRPGIAWALSKSQQFTVEQLLATLVDNNARRWAAFILGMGNPTRTIHKIEALRLQDPEVYFAVTVLWQITKSWVYGLEMYG